jgi:chitinase
MPGNNYPVYPASSTKTVITTTYVDSCETGVTTKTEIITKTVCHKCQDDSVTSVYVCNNCGPSVVTYTITKPATPATNVPSVPTYPAGPSVPSHGAVKPQEPAKPSTPSHDSYPPTYNVPKKQEAPASSTTVEIVYIMKTPVPVLPSVEHKAVPYPTAPVHGTGAAYPVKPSGTAAAPSGTGVPSKPSTYAPPVQFTGAASRAGVGMAGFLAVVAGLLVL